MNHLVIKQIEKQLKSHPFVPPSLLSSSYAQIFAFLITPQFTVHVPTTDRKLIKLPDGSQLAADCWFQEKKENCATVIVLNGFEGFKNNKKPRFGQGIGYKAYNSGYNVIILRQRGEGDTIHLTKSLGDFHADDLEVALSEFNTWGMHKIYIVGLSLGAWSALLSIGRLHANLPKNLFGLIAVSAPSSTSDTWSHIEKQKYFDRMLLNRYKNLIKRRMSVDPPGTWDEKQLRGIKTKRQFMETYMHRFGYPERFASIDEFLKRTDIIPYLQILQLPTLIIHAQDDPVVSVEPFLQSNVQKNPNIITLLPKYGSHGCFIARKKMYEDVDRHWAQNRAIEFIRLLDRKEVIDPDLIGIDDSLNNKV